MTEFQVIIKIWTKFSLQLVHIMEKCLHNKVGTVFWSHFLCDEWVFAKVTPQALCSLPIKETSTFKSPGTELNLEDNTRNDLKFRYASNLEFSGYNTYSMQASQLQAKLKVLTWHDILWP